MSLVGLITFPWMLGGVSERVWTAQEGHRRHGSGVGPGGKVEVLENQVVVDRLEVVGEDVAVRHVCGSGGGLGPPRFVRAVSWEAGGKGGSKGRACWTSGGRSGVGGGGCPIKSGGRGGGPQGGDSCPGPRGQTPGRNDETGRSESRERGGQSRIATGFMESGGIHRGPSVLKYFAGTPGTFRFLPTTGCSFERSATPPFPCSPMTTGREGEGGGVLTALSTLLFSGSHAREPTVPF
jgi:hypothetical protein